MEVKLNEVCLKGQPAKTEPNNGGCNREQVFRGSSRGPGFVARIVSEGLMHPGRGVNSKDVIGEESGANRRERGANRRESGANRSEIMSTGTRDVGMRIRRYACGNLGHVARACRMADGSGRRRVSTGNGPRVQGSSPDFFEKNRARIDYKKTEIIMGEVRLKFDNKPLLDGKRRELTIILKQRCETAVRVPTDSGELGTGLVKVSYYQGSLWLKP